MLGVSSSAQIPGGTNKEWEEADLLAPLEMTNQKNKCNCKRKFIPIK
jgi:hypothetical protein